MERDRRRSSTGKAALSPARSRRQEYLRTSLLDNRRGKENRTVEFNEAAGRKVTRKPHAARYIDPAARLIGRNFFTQESDMGLLDSIVGQVTGALEGSVPGGQVHPGLMDVV